MSIDHEQQERAWDEIYHTYKVNQTANGPGSTIAYTEALREWMPKMLQANDVYTIVDAPCGDLNWIGLVDLRECDYIGLDIQPDMLRLNELRYPQHKFYNHNLLTERDLPKVDLIICRDFLFHLPNEDAQAVLAKFVASGSRLLLTTNLPSATNDGYDRESLGAGMDDRPGYWYRPINLEAAPFNLDGRMDAVSEDDGREMVLFNLTANLDHE